jgi:putative hemolysin
LINLETLDLVNLDKAHKNYKYVIKLKEEIDKALITILIMNNISNVLLSSIPVLIASTLFNNLGAGLMIGLITLLIILFGDIIPKSRAIKYKRKIVLKNSRFIYYNMKILKPLVYILILINKKLNFSKNKNLEINQIINDKTIRDIAIFSEEKGNIKPVERRFIGNILKFGDLTVKEIMIPKEKVYSIRKEISLSELKKEIKNCGYTRVPFILNKKIKGIFYAKDLLYTEAKDISQILRKEFKVQECDDISNVLKLMRHNKVHLAIVYNFEKEFVGVVTLEDILESIVGNIKDEYHKKKDNFG